MRFLRLLLISSLISLSCSYVIMSITMYLSPSAVITGQELLEQIGITLLLGAAISVVSLIFNSEKIPFPIQLALHFFAILALVFTAGYFGEWYDYTDASTIAVIVALTIIIYLFSWWVIRHLLKKEVDDLNGIIQKRRSELK